MKALQRDDGFSLMEIAISMLLAGVIAVAFLPLLISAQKNAASNVTTTAAVQLLNDQLERARKQSSACSQVSAWAASTVDLSRTITDDRGVTMVASVTVTCPTTYPGTARVAIVVKRPTNVTVANATTRIPVLTAS